MKAFVCTGGGVRGLSLAGVLAAGVYKSKWVPRSFDVFTGDSFGSLVAALLANGWKSPQIRQLFLSMPLTKSVTCMPWDTRKLLIPFEPVKLAGIKKFIDSLNLAPQPGLFVNSWNAKENIQYVFCETKPDWVNTTGPVATKWVEKAFSQLGYGTVLTRSMALPGLMADDPAWMDGGLGEHPPLSFLPHDTEITLFNLGYSGQWPVRRGGVPTNLLDRALYSYEVTAYTRTCCDIAPYPFVQQLNPHIYDVDPIDLDMNQNKRQTLIQRGFDNTLAQWENYKL